MGQRWKGGSAVEAPSGCDWPRFPSAPLRTGFAQGRRWELGRDSESLRMTGRRGEVKGGDESRMRSAV